MWLLGTFEEFYFLRPITLPFTMAFSVRRVVEAIPKMDRVAG